MATYKGAIRALVPLLVASVALSVQVAGALGGVGQDLVALRPGVADGPTRTADRGALPVSNAGGSVVQAGESTLRAMNVS